MLLRYLKQSGFFMTILYRILIYISITLPVMTVSCSSPREKQIVHNETPSTITYTIYVINNNLHTGILIPVNRDSLQIIVALKHFTDYEYADFGWGEEQVYQSPADTFCMDAKAILLINPSVMRVEGQNGYLNSLVSWSDFTVRFILTSRQFRRLCEFINDSFTKDPGKGVIISLQKSAGRIIFFRSVYYYHLFHTCNTWVADALEYSGIGISGSFIITAGKLFKAIKDQGTVLKQPR